jgi:hypothetical protein
MSRSLRFGAPLLDTSRPNFLTRKAVILRNSLIHRKLSDYTCRRGVFIPNKFSGEGRANAALLDSGRPFRNEIFSMMLRPCAGLTAGT